MWNSNPSAREIFDEIERRELTDEPAESAFAMKGDWDGKPWDPPARQQPGVYAWGEAHLLLAYIVQFEATRDLRYLDTFVRRFKVLLSLRDDRIGRVDEVRGRIMPGWGSVRFSTNPPHQGKYTSWAVHVGMILFPAARFIHRVESDSSLSIQYASASQAFRTAIVESLTAYEDQWHERQPAGSGDIEGYYTEPMIGAAPLPLNMMNTLGRIMLELHLASPNSRYLDRATKLARFLKNRLVLRPDGAYQWPYRPGREPPYDAGAEDFSHAALNADFMVQCFHAGIVFSPEDMEHLLQMLLSVVYRGQGKFADFINGSGDQNRFADTIAWWGELASINRQVATLIRERYEIRPHPAGGPGGLLAAAMLGKYGY
jgi:hypothetical protein